MEPNVRYPESTLCDVRKGSQITGSTNLCVAGLRRRWSVIDTPYAFGIMPGLTSLLSDVSIRRLDLRDSLLDRRASGVLMARDGATTSISLKEGRRSLALTVVWNAPAEDPMTTEVAVTTRTGHPFHAGRQVASHGSDPVALEAASTRGKHPLSCALPLCGCTSDRQKRVEG